MAPRKLLLQTTLIDTLSEHAAQEIHKIVSNEYHWLDFCVAKRLCSKPNSFCIKISHRKGDLSSNRIGQLRSFCEGVYATLYYIGILVYQKKKKEK